jgi:hypothetical protein
MSASAGSDFGTILRNPLPLSLISGFVDSTTRNALLQCIIQYATEYNMGDAFIGEATRAIHRPLTDLETKIARLAADIAHRNDEIRDKTSELQQLSGRMETFKRLVRTAYKNSISDCTNPRCSNVEGLDADSRFGCCPVCKMAKYCCRECQVENWRRHRRHCERYHWANLTHIDPTWTRAEIVVALTRPHIHGLVNIDEDANDDDSVSDLPMLGLLPDEGDDEIEEDGEDDDEDDDSLSDLPRLDDESDAEEDERSNIEVVD